MSVTREFTIERESPLKGQTFVIEFANDEWSRVERAMEATGLSFQGFVRYADEFVDKNAPDHSDLEMVYLQVGKGTPDNELDGLYAEYVPRMLKERAIRTAQAVRPDPIRGFDR